MAPGAPEPEIAHQARIYPDTVKILSERYRAFSVKNESDMLLYSEIKLSDSVGGKYRITSSESLQWVEQEGTWSILLRYQERIFKTTHTSQTNPDAP